MNYKYITFDPFYDTTLYNRFLVSAFNNNIPYTVLVNIKPPYNFYLRIDEKDVPRFLDFEELSSSGIRWLNTLWNWRFPNEEVILRRKPSDTKLSFEEKISNKVLLQAKKEKCVIFFKFQATKLKEYSRILPNDKFYFLGVKGGYRIGLTFSPYAKSIINPSDIIFVEESGLYRGPGELEAQFNYLWKPNLKLEKKTLDSSYVLNGNFNQITRPLLFLN